MEAVHDWQKEYRVAVKRINELEAQMMEVNTGLVNARQRENKYLAGLLTRTKVLEENLAYACAEIEHLREVLYDAL